MNSFVLNGMPMNSGDWMLPVVASCQNFQEWYQSLSELASSKKNKKNQEMYLHMQRIMNDMLVLTHSNNNNIMLI